MDRSAAAARAAELIEHLDLAEFAHIRCGALSTGQKQRVNIARALVADPPILVMDEPTLGLDVLSNRLILDFIKGQRDAGKTIILSMHYLDEAESMCDKIGLLHDGRLVAEGDIETLREQIIRLARSDIYFRENLSLGCKRAALHALEQEWRAEKARLEGVTDEHARAMERWNRRQAAVNAAIAATPRALFEFLAHAENHP
jgi:ABC-type multidrug transport system ATPase subunit